MLKLEMLIFNLNLERVETWNVDILWTV